MAKIDITKTELVWPGKYNEDGSLREVPRVNLPFQVIERVNESRATREAKQTTTPSLFDFYAGKEGDTFEDGWRNKLIWGDNLLVMGSLLEKFAGKVDLIYIDPPFATGLDFSVKGEIGDETHVKEQSLIEEKAYRDMWGSGIASYLAFFSDRIRLAAELLKRSGTIYVHLDYRLVHYVKAQLDEIFSGNLINEVIWHYQSGGRAEKSFSFKHDTLLLFSHQKEPFFDADAVGIERGAQKRNNMKRGQDPDGRWFWSIKSAGKIYKYYDDEKLTPADVWTDISHLQQKDPERLGYPTQKPEKLLQRVVSASCPPGGLALDFFCGSGTTLAVAEKLGRRWIGCDLGRWAIHTTRKRMLGIENCKPFELLNLGKYERQYWQGVTLGDGQTQEQLLYEYLAFILKLYKAQPISGMAHLHGKKGRAMLHIGAIDSPVTIDEVNLALEECVKAKQPELHVLGWEWEMGLAGPDAGGPMHDEARKKGVKLVLLQIPREVMEQQAVEKGDISFFELAYLDVEIKKPKKLHVAVKLKNFVIPNTELIPEEVRDKVKKWSDYIDYWAVDWDFQNDTFMQGWVTYRTRKDRSLALESEPHKYDKPGTYRILIKVVDIFGNDTSQAFSVKVA